MPRHGNKFNGHGLMFRAKEQFYSILYFIVLNNNMQGNWILSTKHSTNKVYFSKYLESLDICQCLRSFCGFIFYHRICIGYLLMTFVHSIQCPKPATAKFRFSRLTDKQICTDKLQAWQPVCVTHSFLSIVTEQTLIFAK